MRAVAGCPALVASFTHFPIVSKGNWNLELFQLVQLVADNPQRLQFWMSNLTILDRH